MDFKYHGIIINKKDIGEVDRFYIIYTREMGKVRILGKGVRNPNAKLAGHLEPVTYSEVCFAKSKGRGKITGAIAIDNFLNIKSNFLSLSRVFWILGILDKLIGEEEKDERIFVMLLGYLEILNNSSPELTEEMLETVSLGFIFKLLDFLGYRLEVEKCVLCGQKLISGKNYLSVARGGVVCSCCLQGEIRKFSVLDETIKLIRIFLQNDIRNFSKIRADKKVLDNLRLAAKNMIEWIS